MGLTPAASAAVHSTAAPLARCTVGALSPALDNSHVKVTSAIRVTTGSCIPPGTTTPITGLPKFCAVTVTETDAAGKSAIESGYSSSTTDCGLTPSQAATGSFALKPDGSLNWPLISDFARVGIHDAAVEGKAATAAFYRSRPKYSYFLGCSTGGREGLMEAQQYPADYNGIVSGAPAINWTRFIPAEIWPELVMKQAHDFLPSCKETTFTEAVVKACGGADGVISNPSTCDWNPSRLVGLATPCGTITKTDAAVVEKIWRGPATFTGRQLWYGLEPGASFAGLAGTSTAADGTTTGNPFPIATTWLGTWRVQLRMGGAAAADSFARLFLAPGAQHCESAAGPAPSDPLTAVVSWVEHGKAPRSILGTVGDPATGVVTSSRPLCKYPLVSKYKGSGNPNIAASYTCVKGQPVLPGPLRHRPLPP